MSVKVFAKVFLFPSTFEASTALVLPSPFLRPASFFLVNFRPTKIAGEHSEGGSR